MPVAYVACPPPRVLSTNIAVPRPDPGAPGRETGIDKHPAPQLTVFEPGPHYGDGSGVVGDHIGDVDHHGGAQKAVYAYSQEELDHWGRELERTFRPGFFGENLTTEGIDLEELLINQQLHIGSTVLEVSVPRTPCRTFATFLDVPSWVSRFAARGRCGVYLRVVQQGVISPGDLVELGERPGHDVDMRTAFAAAMGDDEAAARVVAAGCLPPLYHDRFVRRLAAAGVRTDPAD